MSSILMATVFACLAALQQLATPVVVRDTVLRMSSGAEYAPGLHGLRYHGSVVAGASTLFVLSGFECDDCDAPRSVHFLRLGERVNLQNRNQPAFAFPGLVRDSEGARVSWSRLFFGSCSPDPTIVAVQVASALEDDGRWHNTASTARVQGDSTVVSTGTLDRVILETATSRLGRGCSELRSNHRQTST